MFRLSWSYWQLPRTLTIPPRTLSRALTTSQVGTTAASEGGRENPRVLITGGAGQLGTALARILRWVNTYHSLDPVSLARLYLSTDLES